MRAGAVAARAPSGVFSGGVFASPLPPPPLPNPVPDLVNAPVSGGSTLPLRASRRNMRALWWEWRQGRWLLVWRKIGPSARCTTTAPALPPPLSPPRSPLRAPGAGDEQAISAVHRDLWIAAMRGEVSGLAVAWGGAGGDVATRHQRHLLTMGVYMGKQRTRACCSRRSEVGGTGFSPARGC